MVWVYILKCANGSFYTGYTNNLKQRFKMHFAGKVKFTSSFKPVELGACWQCPTPERGPALVLECAIKKLDHRSKQKLIQNPDSLSDFVSDKVNTQNWSIELKGDTIFNALMSKDQQQS